jgi:hypothetical protein
MVDTLIAVLAGAFSILAARTIVSFDSYLYLASARSLFTDRFTMMYQWIREPGYTLMLRAIHDLLGNADVWLIIVQVAISMVGIGLLFAAWFPTRAMWRRVGIAIASLNPIVIGFSGWVGQQIIIMAIVCGVVATCVIVLSGRPADTRVATVLGGTMGACAGLMSALLGPMVAGASLVLVAAGVWAWRSDRAKARRLMLAGGAMGTLFLVALLGWWAIKAAMYDPASTILPDDPVWIWEHDGSPGTQEPGSIGTKLLGYAALTYDSTGVEEEASAANRAFQVKVFGGVLAPFDARCGFAFPGPAEAEIMDYIGGYMVPTCRPSWAARIDTALGGPGLQIYRLAMLAMLISPVVAVFHRRTRLPALLSYLLLLPYIVSSGGPLSRYGMPLYPLGVGMVLLWITSALPIERSKSHAAT